MYAGTAITRGRPGDTMSLCVMNTYPEAAALTKLSADLCESIYGRASSDHELLGMHRCYRAYVGCAIID